jgi:hypothetical protein
MLAVVHRVSRAIIRERGVKGPTLKEKKIFLSYLLLSPPVCARSRDLRGGWRTHSGNELWVGNEGRDRALMELQQDLQRESA